MAASAPKTPAQDGHIDVRPLHPRKRGLGVELRLAADDHVLQSVMDFKTATALVKACRDQTAKLGPNDTVVLHFKRAETGTKLAVMFTLEELRAFLHDIEAALGHHH